MEAAEKSLESSFQALELQKITLRDDGAIAMVAKVMLKSGYEVGKGLGATLQGNVEPIPAIQKVGHFGLGFEEDALMDGRFWRRNMLRDQRFDQRVGKMKVVPKITDIFNKSIIENREEGDKFLEEPSVDVIQLDSLYEALISPTAEGQELNNWEEEDLPVLNLE